MRYMPLEQTNAWSFWYIEVLPVPFPVCFTYVCDTTCNLPKHGTPCYASNCYSLRRTLDPPPPSLSPPFSGIS